MDQIDAVKAPPIAGPARNDDAQAGAAMPAVVEVFDDLAGLDRIRSFWDALEARTPEATGFQSFAFCRAWAAASTTSRDRPFVLGLWQNGRLVLLWPFMLHRVCGITIANWLGDPLAQYGDVLVEPDQRARWLETAWQALKQGRHIDIVNLRNVRADAALTALPAFRDLWVSGRENAYFAEIELADMRLQGRAAKALDRRARRLGTLGPVRFEVPKDADTCRSVTKDALDLKDLWLKSRDLVSRGLSHSATRACLVALADSGELEVCRLGVGEANAAIELGLNRGGVYRSLIGSYDLRFAEGAPGSLLIREKLRHCADTGIKVYDFMAPADEYKKTWATGAVAVSSRVQARSLAGLAACAYMVFLRPALKRLYMRAPSGLRVGLRHVARHVGYHS